MQYVEVNNDSDEIIEKDWQFQYIYTEWYSCTVWSGYSVKEFSNVYSGRLRLRKPIKIRVINNEEYEIINGPFDGVVENGWRISFRPRHTVIKDEFDDGVDCESTLGQSYNDIIYDKDTFVLYKPVYKDRNISFSRLMQHNANEIIILATSNESGVILDHHDKRYIGRQVCINIKDFHDYDGMLEISNDDTSVRKRMDRLNKLLKFFLESINDYPPTHHEYIRNEIEHFLTM